jgi:D-3-phosphoglycerate dehydrogenase
MERKVLITDYAWKSLEPEREILRGASASLIVAKTGLEDELAELAADADGILTNWKPVTAKTIRQAPKCVSIGRYGIGLDNIDVACATELGIIVTNVPAYCIEEVSEHTLALLLSLARKVTFFDRAIKGGSYDLQAQTPLYRISGRTLGIVGFGKIGRAVYRKAIGFGLRILVYSPHAGKDTLKGLEVTAVGFEELLGASDYVSIHAPLTAETRHLFGYEAFRKMKPTAFVINTSRGGIIDSAALLKALDKGLIAGAGLDVLSQEPPGPDDPLVHHAKTIVTPHAAFNSEESLLELQTIAARQMADVLSGRMPDNIVNSAVLRQANLRASIKVKP